MIHGLSVDLEVSDVFLFPQSHSLGESEYKVLTYLFRGAFKLEKSGQLPTDCYGVQAHLSTRASSKVVDLVHKFSPELRLKEVPRLHTWPLRFQNNHLTEKDIALYFFAQDLWRLVMLESSSFFP